MALIAGARTTFSSFKLAFSATWEHRPRHVGRHWVWRTVARRDFWNKRWLLPRWDGFSSPLGISLLKLPSCFLPLSLPPCAHGLPVLGTLAAHKWFWKNLSQQWTALIYLIHGNAMNTAIIKTNAAGIITGGTIQSPRRNFSGSTMIESPKENGGGTMRFCSN
jgi:hypothetical protein